MSKNLNSTSNLFVALIFSGVGITYFVGCEVDKADVTAARQNVAEEQSETESVRQADEQRVREAEKRLAEARLSAKKVPYEGGKDDIVLEKEKELVEEATKRLDENGPGE